MSEARPEGYPARRLFVVVVMAAVTATLMWRAIDLQLNHKEFLQGQGDARHLRVVSDSAHRGKILDRNHQPLAISTPVDSVWANPRELVRHPARWEDVTRSLGLDLDRLTRNLEARRKREFMYLRRHVDPAVAAAIRKLEIPGVYLRREYRRYYPLGEVAAHVVGFTNVDDRGQEGMELAFDQHLQGTDGNRRVLQDRLGRVVEEVERLREPKAGRDISLSVDRRIQNLTYRALLSAVNRHKARAGSAVVMDADSGEILAMVNQPSYNPNNRADRVSNRVRNRAVTDVFEPGSTIKPFTIAAALESGRYRLHTRIDTRPGRFRVGRHTIRDLRNYGVIDLATVVRKSSNVGASKVALSLEARELWQSFTRVGFGATTASEFPGESEGVLRHFFTWGDIERATLSYGYGLSVTALQLAQAYAVIANDGLLPEITFLRNESDNNQVRVMAGDTARQIQHMLETVVGADGTGQRARVAGYRVGGKTGTVKKSIRGGYAEDRYVALFAGIAPISNPRLVAVVLVDEPNGEVYYGGQVAAPVFSEIVAGALRVLGVAPDDENVVTRRIAATGTRPVPGAVDQGEPRIYANASWARASPSPRRAGDGRELPR